MSAAGGAQCRRCNGDNPPVGYTARDMARLLPLQGPMRFNWANLNPPRRASPPWYLRWPQPVIDLVRGNPMNAVWFCMPATVEEANEFRPHRVYAAYCGAPPGVRCRCGAQLDGHDPGDEQ